MKILENREGCADSQIFNIGNPQEIYSIKNLADILIAEISKYPDFSHLARDAKIELVAGEDYYAKGYQDVEYRAPSIDKAKRILGWAPKTTLPEAIKCILDFHLLGVDNEDCL